MTLSNLLITLFASGTLFIQAACILLAIFLVVSWLKPKNKKVKRAVGLIQNNYIIIVLTASALATAGSLSLSEILAFVPCKLCWYQRIAMYPITVISLAAVIKNEIYIKKYVLPLSIIGFLVALYHVLLQLFPTILQCSDEVAKCSAVQFAQFGYITIPVMALSFFLFVILISLIGVDLKKR